MKVRHPIEKENDFIEIETKKTGLELSQFSKVSPISGIHLLFITIGCFVLLDYCGISTGPNGFKCAQIISSPLTASVKQSGIPVSVIIGGKLLNSVSSLKSLEGKMFILGRRSQTMI